MTASVLHQPTLVRLHEVPLTRARVTPESIVRDYLVPLFDGVDREQSVVVSLDLHDYLLGVDVIGVGTVGQVTMAPREVFRAALQRGAARIVTAHSHPMGLARPSEADVANARAIEEAGRMMDIPLIDSLVVSHDGSWESALHPDYGNHFQQALRELYGSL